MKKGLVITLVVLGLVGIVAIFAWGSYNRLISAEENVNNKWAQVETQYQRRFDLIPNLVESVKGAMEQEQEVFGEIAEARTRYAGAETVDEKVKAAGEVESALARLLVIMENYPELKSIEAVQTLMAQLEGTENRISVERKRYNDAVKSYNLLTKRLPTNLIARLFGFEEKPYFESVEGADAPPGVEF